jgi:hypothetical protein
MEQPPVKKRKIDNINWLYNQWPNKKCDYCLVRWKPSTPGLTMSIIKTNCLTIRYDCLFIRTEYQRIKQFDKYYEGLVLVFGKLILNFRVVILLSIYGIII